MKVSAGVIIKYNNKILLCHPTNSGWKNTFSLPKGEVMEGESLRDCAIRETFEETGIVLNRELLSTSYIEIPYKNKTQIYKTVYLFTYFINNLSQINLLGEIIPRENIQLSEVDWVGFLDKKDIEEKIFWRFKEEILKLI